MGLGVLSYGVTSGVVLSGNYVGWSGYNKVSKQPPVIGNYD